MNFQKNEEKEATARWSYGFGLALPHVGRAVLATCQSIGKTAVAERRRLQFCKYHATSTIFANSSEKHANTAKNSRLFGAMHMHAQVAIMQL